MPLVRAPRQAAPAALGLAILVLPALLAWTPGPATAAQVPCQIDPVCPDLIVDPVRMRQSVDVVTRSFGPNDCNIAEAHVPGPGAHKLLRFTFNTPNLGPGDLYVGNPRDHPEWFTWGACHRHYHFREYADYRLWTLDGYAAWVQARAADPLAPASEVLAANPDIARQFLAGNKQGFCVIDLTTIGGLPLTGLYFSCGDQGISPGFADEYHKSLDGQWIVVSNVPAGNYMLEAEVNAERLYKETTYANNAWAVPVKL